MPDANDLVKAMKRTALDAVEANKPANVYFGTVISSAPLKINVEQKMVLTEAQLVLTRNVTNYDMTVTVDYFTAAALSEHTHGVNIASKKSGEPEHVHQVLGDTGAENLSHTHDISGKVSVTVNNSLTAGDQVIIIRQQGGQKFVVVDRIGVMG